MIYKKLKNIQLPTIGQGMGMYKWSDIQVDIIHRGIELGMNFIDTAENYNDSEILIGRAIKNIRDKVIIGTKFSPEHSSYNKVIEAAERSLKRLGTDYIDLYQLHWPNPEVSIEETLGAMKKLVKDGKVKYIGLCNVYDINLLKNIDVLQIEYNLFDRFIEDEIVDVCNKNKIIITSYTPLDHGRVSNPECKRFVMELSRKYNKTQYQIALRWITRKNNVVAIPKTSDLIHLVDNSSIDFDIDEDDIDALDSFREKTVLVYPESVVVMSGEKKVYTTIEDAKANLLGFTPSPTVLAKDFLDTGIIKPIRITEENILVEGSVRYWAWRLAFGNVPIPALVRR